MPKNEAEWSYKIWEVNTFNVGAALPRLPTDYLMNVPAKEGGNYFRRMKDFVLDVMTNWKELEYDPALDGDDPTKYTVFIVAAGPDRGCWVRRMPVQTKKAQTLYEIIAGRKAVLENQERLRRGERLIMDGHAPVFDGPVDMGPVRHADNEKWARLIGLAFLGQAEKYEL